MTIKNINYKMIEKELVREKTELLEKNEQQEELIN